MDNAIDLILEQLHSWYINFWRMLPNFVAVVIFIIAYVQLFSFTQRSLIRFLEHTIYFNLFYEFIVNFSYVTIIIVTGLLISIGILKLDYTVKPDKCDN